MSLADRIAAVQKRIDVACAAAGRTASQVRLLPVSKTQPAAVIRAAHELGLARFGENRVQELATKAATLSDTDIKWTLVGHLQTNKAKVAVAHVSEIQSLDSLKLARTLERHLQELGRSLAVLIEVNTSCEDAKSGLPPEQVLDFARQLAPFETIRVKGLMTVALQSLDPAAVGACFDRLVTLQAQLRDDGVLSSDWNELSMGMSEDFELAIAHGATTVRIGTALFGPRP